MQPTETNIDDLIDEVVVREAYGKQSQKKYYAIVLKFADETEVLFFPQDRSLAQKIMLQLENEQLKAEKK